MSLVSGVLPPPAGSQVQALPTPQIVVPAADLKEIYLAYLPTKQVQGYFHFIFWRRSHLDFIRKLNLSFIICGSG